MSEQLASQTEKEINEQASSHGLLRFQNLPLDPALCDHLFDQLCREIDWQQDSFVAFDRKFLIPRLQAWYADKGLQYRYADNLLETQPWIEPLLQLRQIVCNTTGYPFNAVLATCYRSGRDHVTWHSDDERELGDAPVIASLSLGASRRFQFRHKDQRRSGEVTLHHGDFLVMESAFQHHWEHQVPEEPTVQGCRINLTFRRVFGEANN